MEVLFVKLDFVVPNLNFLLFFFFIFAATMHKIKNPYIKVKDYCCFG